MSDIWDALRENLHRIPDAQHGKQLLDLLIGNRRAAAGPIRSLTMPMDADTATQRRAPIGTAPASEGIENTRRFTGGYQPVTQPAFDRGPAGIADTQEPMVRTIGVLGHDAEGSFRCSAVPGVPLPACRCGSEVDRVRPNQDLAIEKMKLPLALEDDDAGMIDS